MCHVDEAVQAQKPSDHIAAGTFDALLQSADAFPDPSLKSQLLANFHTFLGRVDLNAELQGLPGNTECVEQGVRVASGRTWLEAQAEASTPSLLMFNENHFTLASRVFVRSLLAPLREQGFTHIGLEALAPFEGGDIEAQLANGYYLIEPAFTALVREAQQLGYTIFGYESTTGADPSGSSIDRIRRREQGQTDNISQVMAQAPPDARFIFYAGWSHIAEAPLLAGPDGELRWMAALLKEHSGIDPLTIDLVTCGYETSDPEARDGQVLFDNTDAVIVEGPYAGAVDAQIRLPVPGRRADLRRGPL